MNFLATDKSRYVRLAYVAIAFLVALLAEFLFWQQTLGLGAFLLVLVYVAIFTTVAFATNFVHQRLALLFLIPIFILSFDLVIYANDFVRTFVPLSICVLVFLYSIFLTLKNRNSIKFYFKNIPVLNKLTLIFENWGKVIGDLFYWRKLASPNEKYKKIAIGLIISIPILLVFIMLFASADAVFQQGLDKIFSVRFNFDPINVWRAVRVMFLTLLAGSFFYVILSDEHEMKDNVKVIAPKLDHTVVTVVLSLVNILFLLFVIIQIRYLFGAGDYLQVAGITFADYARRGFFELVWVMIISAVILLVLFRSASYNDRSITVSVLKLILIAQILLIATSALRRMNLYQDEYGYTTLRLYVEWFIYFSGIMFLFLAFVIIKNSSFKRFVYTGLIFGLLAFTTVASVNVDGIISKKNVDRYLLEGKKLDFDYLVNYLSTDAIPEIAKLKGKTVERNISKEDISMRLNEVSVFLSKRKTDLIPPRNSPGVSPGIESTRWPRSLLYYPKECICNIPNKAIV
ncbi:MAG: DUF4153 domain-containing protein, partial [Candidatus Magasanikbacteria bacterium]